MRVALYARVSTEAQEQRGTIGSQVEALREGMGFTDRIALPRTPSGAELDTGGGRWPASTTHWGEYLESRENDTVELTFAKVDRIVGGLPPSARAHRAWWGNERDGRHTHARVWLRAGWVVEHVNLTAESVRFRRQPDGWSLVSVTRGGLWR